MRPVDYDKIGWLLLAFAAAILATSCTLDVTTPDEPPPDSWDSALNTHPGGPAFQKLLDRYVRSGLPGVVLFVRTPHGLWNGASGCAKLETATPMLPAHRHFAASVTKMYTASAVMILAQDGVIDLDAKIARYLPESVCGRVPNAAGSTARQLLGHTSGIPDFGVFAYDLDTFNDPMGSFPPERLLSYVEGEPAIFEPGAGYLYSNTNYLLLALIMDRVTGKGHANVISERILEPLGLGATYYKNEPGYPAPPGLVNSYQDLAGDGKLVNVTDLTTHSNEMYIGYTGLIATSADFAAFIQALLDGRVVDQESLAEMMERTESASYGLGLHFLETDFGTGIGHNGSDFGILAEVRHFPDLDATIVLLVNGGDSGVTEQLFERLRDDALRIALGDVATD